MSFTITTSGGQVGGVASFTITTTDTGERFRAAIKIPGSIIDAYASLGQYSAGTNTFTIPSDQYAFIPANATQGTSRLLVESLLTGDEQITDLPVYATADALSAGTITVNTTYTPVSGINIANASTFTVGWSGASPSTGSSIASVRINAGPQSWSATPGASGSKAIGTIVSSGQVLFSIEVIDRRGFTAYSSTYVPVLPYTPPDITSFIANRCDIDGNPTQRGEYISVTAAWELSSVKKNNVEQNSLVSAVLAIEDTPGNYVTKETVTSGSTLSKICSMAGGYDTETSYNIKLTVLDTIGDTLSPKVYTYSIIVVGTEPTIMDFYHDGTGLAVGKVAETSNLFDIAMPTKVLVGNSTKLDVSDSEIWLGDTNSSANRNGISLNGANMNKVVSGTAYPIRTIIVSTSDPAGGSNGDIWIKVNS